MFIIVSVLYHLKSIQSNLARFDASATIDVSRLALNVWGRNKYYQFTPQFLRKINGRMSYTPQLPDDPRGFVGWLPYFNKRWDLALDKLLFKEYCLANALESPAFSRHKADSIPGFLVKSRASSFGQGIRGPFRQFDPSNPAQLLRENEYYDQFIPGTMGKAWYWNDKLVCCELREMPKITGNGVDSARTLIAAHLGQFGFTPAWEDFAGTLEFHGCPLDGIPGEGQRVVADFRFGSLLLTPDWNNHNVLREHRETRLGDRLRKAGPIFWRGVPAEIRDSTLYTIDFIADREGRAWFLEMNCNPMVHPDIYPDMLEDLFGSPKNIPTNVPVGQGVPVPGMLPPGPMIPLFPGQGMPLPPHGRVPSALNQPSPASGPSPVFPRMP